MKSQGHQINPEWERANHELGAGGIITPILRTPREWAKLLEINIIDWDGFPDRNPDGAPVTKEQFSLGAIYCTQMPFKR